MVLFVMVLISASGFSAFAQEGERSPITASNAGQVKLLREFETLSRSYMVFFSPDGQRLATLNEDNSIWVWDAASGEEVSVFQSPEPLWYGVFSPMVPF